MCIQDVKTIPAVTAVQQSVPVEGRSVHPALVHEIGNVGSTVIYLTADEAVCELLGTPPVTDLDGIAGVGDIQDTDDHALESLAFAGEEHISSSVIHEPVNTD